MVALMEASISAIFWQFRGANSTIHLTEVGTMPTDAVENRHRGFLTAKSRETPWRGVIFPVHTDIVF